MFILPNLSLISMLAVINGALVQMIMSSRMLYGLGAISHLPAWFVWVNERTLTPIHSTVVVASAILVLALLFDLEALAELTSSLTLMIFATVNLALVVNKRRNPVTDGFSVPMIVPVLGFVISLALFGARFLG